MPTQNRVPRIAGLMMMLLLFLAAAAGCTTAAAEVAPATTPSPGVVAPAQVVAAREAVLDFMRTGANCICPPANARWEASMGEAPPGFSVYRFGSGEHVVLVSYATPMSADTAFHVGMHNERTGFCWQANVNANGRITATGQASELMPELVNTAAAYCRDQGNTYKVRGQADGGRCGECIFPDGSSCNAWAYFQGQCAPGEG